MLDAELDRPGAAGMGGDALAVGPADVADRLDLGLRHHGPLGPRMGDQLVARRIDLQRVHALAHEDARRLAEFIGAVADDRE